MPQVKGHVIVDKLKSMGDQFSGDALKSQLQDIHFPASKDQVCSQLQQKGVPSQVVDKLRNVDTSQFDSADEVMNKVKSFM